MDPFGVAYRHGMGIVLLSADSQAVNADGGRGHAAAEFEVAPEVGDVVEDVVQVSRNGDLFDRKGQFTVDDPESRGAARVVAGNQVHTHAEKLGDIETIFNVANNLLGRLRSGVQEVVAGADAGGAGEPARCVGSGFEAEFLGRVSVQQIRLQHAVLNDNRAACRDAFSVKRRRAEAADHGAVVDHGDVTAGNLLAQLAREE